MEVPFVLMFEKIGIGPAAGIINFVVLTAALSSCNSGIFSTGRMLFNLAEQKQASASFKKISGTGVPSKAILFSAFLLLIGVLLNYLVPEKVFIWVTSISTFGAVWTWGIILLSQLKFRKSLSKGEVSRLTYKALLYPLGSYLVLAFLVLVLALMAYFPDTRIALIVGPIWVISLVFIYYKKGFHKQ